GHLDIRARRAGDGDAEAVVEVEFSNGLAEYVVIGDDDPAKADAALGEDEIFVDLAADDSLELIEPTARANDGETIVPANYRRIGRGAGLAAAPHARDCDARFETARECIETHAVEIGIGDKKRAPGQGLGLPAMASGKFGRFLCRIDAEDAFEDEQCAD